MPKCGNPECCVSESITGHVTFGSGILDPNGFWEKPCLICATAYKKMHPDEDMFPRDEAECKIPTQKDDKV